MLRSVHTFKFSGVILKARPKLFVCLYIYLTKNQLTIAQFNGNLIGSTKVTCALPNMVPFFDGCTAYKKK